MALLTDDSDVETAYIRTYMGGNGDYYIEITKVDDQGFNVSNKVRISTSGGNSPLDVKLAVSNLHNALEKHGLNEFPD